MEYTSGRVGRVFVARFDDGEDFLGELRDLVIKEDIRNAWFHVLGGLRNAGVVTGPREPVMPPDPVWARVDETRETLGTGSIFWDNDEPRIHLHAALGLHGETMTACVRKDTKVYLILEVYIIEVADINAGRPWNERCGFNRIRFS